MSPLNRKVLLNNKLKLTKKINLAPLLAPISLCVILSQSVEFLLRSIVMSFRQEINNKFISELKTIAICESTKNGEKLRKRTLGLLKNLIKDVEILNVGRSEKYVIERNYIVCSIWENKIASDITEKSVQRSLTECQKFVDESKKLESSLKGAAFILAKTMKQIDPILNIDSIQKFAPFGKDFDNY